MEWGIQGCYYKPGSGYRHTYTVNTVPAFAVKVLNRASQRNLRGTRLFRILYPPISSIDETPADDLSVCNASLDLTQAYQDLIKYN